MPASTTIDRRRIDELAGLAPGMLHGHALKAISERDWSAYLCLFGHATRADAFVEILPELDDEPSEVYWSMLGEAWSSTEAPGIGDIDWRALFTDHGITGRAALMDETGLTVFETLPERVTVYRGVGCLDRARGLSWTLDRDKARWFATYAERQLGRSGTARRGDVGRACVLRGELARVDVIAVLEVREEREVIALPESVQDLHVIEPPEDAQAIGGER